MSETDIAVVRKQFEAVNARDFERAMSLYAEDVVLVVPGADVKTGTFEGKEAVGEWFGDWFRQFGPDYRFDIDEARELPGGHILIHAEHGGRGRVSGAVVRDDTTYLYRVRDGKVTHVAFFWQREDALRAAGMVGRSEGETH